MNECIEIEEICINYLNGYIMKNSKIQRKGSVILFGGSEGSCNYDKAIELASDGYFILALFFFGKENQNKTLTKVPIEFIHDAISLLKEKNENYDKVTVIGGSKGGELSLVLGTIEKEIDNIVAYVPSSHVFQGLDFSNIGSSWMYKGKEIEYISFKSAKMSIFISIMWQKFVKKKVAYRKYYESALSNAENKEGARIKIENFKGNLLMFSGTDDQMWDSAVMTKEVVKIRKGLKTENYIFEGAGHTFGKIEAGDQILGGTIEDNKIASIKNRKILNESLNKWHPFI
ncbi:MAG: acyl-CoA thioester hydrolase/BAAT C-terminal domain-containing protein [Clostridium sp.]